MSDDIDLDRAEFLATTPDIMSALMFGSDVVRVKLEIPLTDLHEAVKLIPWRGRVLRVVIVPETLTVLDNETQKEPERGSPEVDSGRTAIRRNKR